MRVTNSMLYNNTIYFMNLNMSKYYRLQEQLSSQKAVNRPSDDPVSTSRILDIKVLLGEFDQYERNLATAESYVTQTEVVLTNAVDLMGEAIELAVAINQSTTGQDEFEQAAQQMDGIRSGILSCANSKLVDRFLFSGFMTDTQPFDDTGTFQGGSGQEIRVEVANGEYLTINMLGDEVFTSDINVFQLLEDITTAIENQDQEQISVLLDDMQTGLNQLVTAQAKNGTRVNRVEVAKEDVEDMRYSFTAILSDIEDLDLVAATTKFTQQEQVLQAVQLVSTSILQQNFLDFYD